MNMLDQVNSETRPPKQVKVRRKRRRSKKPYMLILAVSLVLAFVLSVVGYGIFSTRYSSDFALAQTGIQHLQKAASLLGASPQNISDAHSVNQAQQEFSAALKVFVQLDNDLQSIPVVATLAPVYGTRLSAALHLVPLAIALSQA